MKCHIKSIYLGITEYKAVFRLLISVLKSLNSERDVELFSPNSKRHIDDITQSMTRMSRVSGKWTEFLLVETRRPGEWFISGQINGLEGQKDRK